MIVATNYANAYKEVLIIINNLVKQDYEKIPKKYIEYLEENCNNDYKFEYDKTKSFNEQNLLDDTKYILFGLFEKFGATDKQKSMIKSFKINCNKKLDEKKKEQYNLDNIFKNKIENSIDNEITNNLPIEVNKENIFTKILKFISKIFH